ncbi:alpha/beta hydrolase [Actinocrispum wychmicini]|uniref:TAP-like protein n=1 Tax=Actinocrispum wychmicini TaxID=1213861 RepID=A0A4R2IZ06_9PSEU|nr:alpha/beta hydrolase [Actinocrispum wychmicini]TCO50854.1 TAP-like protein [Actinocrispum wychmicini]
MRWRKVGLVAAVISTALTVPAAASTGLEWVGCGAAEAECAELTVPLDWHRPDGRPIRVAIDRHKANPATRKGVLFMAPGVGFDFVLTGVKSGLFAKFPDLLRDFDIIGVDTRGGGLHPFYGRQPAPFRTDAITCGSPVHDPDVNSFPRNGSEFDALVRHNRAYAANCDSPLLGYMDAVSQARDLEAVRVALGEQSVSMFFFGYLGPVGQTYASMFPDRVRAMALDSPVDHSVPVVARAVDFASTVEREFDRFVAWCDRSTSCVLHGADVKAIYDNLLRQADKEPVRLDLPPEPGQADPQQRTVLVKGNDLAFLTEQALEIGDLSIGGAHSGWFDLAVAIAESAKGTSPTFSFFYRYSWGYRDLWNPFRAGTCQDFPTTVADLAVSEPIVAAVAPHTRGASQAWDAMSGCVGWPVRGTNPPQPTLVRGAPPILVIGAQGNPWSPYERVASVSAQIQGSVLLTYAGDAHIAFLSSQCVIDTMQRYLDTLVTPPPGTVCPAIPT